MVLTKYDLNYYVGLAAVQIAKGHGGVPLKYLYYEDKNTLKLSIITKNGKLIHTTSTLDDFKIKPSTSEYFKLD